LELGALPTCTSEPMTDHPAPATTHSRGQGRPAIFDNNVLSEEPGLQDIVTPENVILLPQAGHDRSCSVIPSDAPLHISIGRPDVARFCGRERSQ
jgi:hypothetical protein